MKTIRKIYLTKKELGELKGGDDIYNQNTVPGCTCTYKNGTSITYNSNSIEGCGCKCV